MQHLETGLVVLEQQRQRAGIRVVVDAEVAVLRHGCIVRPLGPRAARVVVEPQKAGVRRPKQAVERRRGHAEIPRYDVQQPERDRIAGGIERLDARTKAGQRPRPLRTQRRAIGRTVVIDLLPVARASRQLLVVEAPWILGRAQIACLASSGWAKNARISRLSAQSSLGDAVTSGLEEAPVAARGIDPAAGRFARGARDVEDGQCLVAHGPIARVRVLTRSCAAAAISAAANTDRCRRPCDSRYLSRSAGAGSSPRATHRRDPCSRRRAGHR